MSLCPESWLRQQMDDGEFWTYVLRLGEREHDYDPDDDPNLPRSDDPVTFDRPCPECGEFYACGYDTEGRPMVHVSDEDEVAS